MTQSDCQLELDPHPLIVLTEDFFFPQLLSLAQVGSLAGWALALRIPCPLFQSGAGLFNGAELPNSYSLSSKTNLGCSVMGGVSCLSSLLPG